MRSSSFRSRRARVAATAGLAALVVATAPASIAAAAPKPAPIRAAASATATPLTAEQALAEAQRTGQAVEATGATTATDTLTANPNGSLTLTRTATPVRKRVQGTWKTLDATLGRNSDGALSPAVSTNALKLSGGGTGPLATMVSGGKTLALTAEMTLPAPTTSGATATYASVLPGVDLKVTADLNGGFSELFVVRDATAATNPALAQLTLSTHTDGITLSSDPIGNISANDRLGHPVFTAPAPLMWDSAAPSSQPASSGGTAKSPAALEGPGDSSHTAPVAVSLSAGRIDLTPDANLISSPNTVYPLYIDPDWSSLPAGNNGWATITHNHPTSKYWNTTPDDEGQMQVGNSGVMWSRTLINFPINTSTLAGATIDSAAFSITETWSYSCSPRVVNLYAPATTLTSSNASWDAWEGVGLGAVVASANVAYGYKDCPGHGVGFNVKKTIRDDVAANKRVQTFALVAADESDENAWKEFAAKSPTLVITYNHAPNTPTGMSTSPSTTCGGATTTTVGKGPVSLYAPVSDPDGNKLGVSFKLWKTSDPTQTPVASSSPTTLSAASGATAVLAIPQATLDAAVGTNSVVQLSWQIQVADGITTSAWSATCSFKYDTARIGKPEVKLVGSATIGQRAQFTITPPASAIKPTSYSYQVNGGAPGEATATDGVATIEVIPTRFTNMLTVTSLSEGGNFGDTAPLPFNATPAADAADGDLTGDNVADLLAVGGPSGLGLPSGLWLAAGKNGGVVPTATDIGAYGNETGGGDNPTAYNGAQVITGRLTGNGVQDVLAYYPTGPNAGGGTVISGSGDGTVLQAQQSSNQYPFLPGRLSDLNNNNPLQIANAGNTSGQNYDYPDLIGISGDPHQRLRPELLRQPRRHQQLPVPRPPCHQDPDRRH